MALKPLIMLLAASCMTLFAYSQENPDVTDKIANFPASFFDKINKKTASLEDRLKRQTEKYLQRMARQERKLQERLSKVDSNAAKQLFASSQQQYRQLANKINSDSLIKKSSAKGGYVSTLDTLKTSLSFLQQNNRLLGNTSDAQQKIKESLGSVKQLESKLKQSEEVKAFVQQRKQLIKQQLSKYTNLPSGVTDCVTDFNKEVYYYKAQLKEYKETLKDPDLMAQKGMTLLNKLPAFTQFMKQHSELASIFPVPANYGSTASIAGLQTRTQIQQQIQNVLAGGGSNAQQYLQQNLQAAQAQLNQLKDKINKLGSSGGDIDMPDFKPNGQKTKTFWQRLDYGTNFQTARTNYFPVTTDIGLSVGYKINDKNTIGIGASYKVGWGQDIKHISITQQGIGIRSYVDIKLKGSFYASGGYEYNYQPVSPEVISSVSSLGKVNDPGAWSKSGLVGISKIISLKSKFFKKTKVQLLWDFLSYQQAPRTQAFKYRVGYNL